MLLLSFQVLLPPYEEAISIPPKDPPPQYVSAWESHHSFTTLLPNLLQRNNLVTVAHSVAPVSCLSLCDVSLLSPLLSGGSSMTLRRPSLDKAAQLSWQPNAVCQLQSDLHFRRLCVALAFLILWTTQ